MKDPVFTGRIWTLTDAQGALIEDIDTDQIYHNAFLHITDISQMGQYALGNLKGWEDFPHKAEPGDILIAGRNFGAGSSRQQAVDCFVALGVSMLISPSFGAIYFRNAVNSGFPVMNCGHLPELVLQKKLESGDRVRIDIQTGESLNISKNQSFHLDPVSQVQHSIWGAGNLFAFGKSLNKD